MNNHKQRKLDYINAVIREANYVEPKAKTEMYYDTDFQKAMNESNKIKEEEQSYFKFREEVRSVLLKECLSKLFNESFGIVLLTEADRNVMNAMVSTYIEENMATTLLNRFKNGTGLLREFYLLVDKHSGIITEKADKKNKESFSIEPSDKDTFMDDLNMTDCGEVTEMIKMRVATAIDEFIEDNIRDKADIEDTINSIKDKMDSAKTEAVREMHNQTIKGKVHQIRSRRNDTIFESMVKNITSSVIKNEAMREEFMIDNRPNLDKIVDRSRILYTFVEMLNTTEMERVNEEYLTNMLNDLK